MTSEKLKAMPFGKVYPCLVAKAERKGRSREEVDTLTSWLTGYPADEIHCMETDGTTYGEVMASPYWSEDGEKIRGSICGVRVETIEDPFMRRVRELDKVIDELAKGKSTETIMAGKERG
ncbi:MAG: DUF2200 family protein [Lachnospiraceae bacterium]